MPRGPTFVQYCAKDFLDGVQFLSPWEELAYRRLCDLIYKSGGPLGNDDKKLARMTKTGSRWAAIKAALMADDKVFITDDGRIMNRRCERELEKTAQFLQQKSAAGHASAATGKSLKNLKQHRTEDRTGHRTKGITKKESFSKENEGELGRSAPLERDAPTAEDIAEVDRLVGMAKANLNGGMPGRYGNGVHDPAAYDAAVAGDKRDAWLNNLSQFAGEILSGNDRMAAWEAIEQARSAGSRQATPKHVRKALDKLDELYREHGND